MKKAVAIIFAFLLASMFCTMQGKSKKEKNKAQDTVTTVAADSVLSKEKNDSMAQAIDSLVQAIDSTEGEATIITLVEAPEQVFINDTVVPLCNKMRDMLNKPFDKAETNSTRKLSWAIIANHNNGVRKLSDLTLFCTLDTLDIYLSRYEIGDSLFNNYKKKAEPLLQERLPVETCLSNNSAPVVYVKAANRYTAIDKLLHPSDKKTKEERAYNQKRFFNTIPYLHKADSLLTDSLEKMASKYKPYHDECITRGEKVIEEIKMELEKRKDMITRIDDYYPVKERILSKNKLKQRLNEEVLAVDDLKERWQEFEAAFKPKR